MNKRLSNLLSQIYISDSVVISSGNYLTGNAFFFTSMSKIISWKDREGERERERETAKGDGRLVMKTKRKPALTV